MADDSDPPGEEGRDGGRPVAVYVLFVLVLFQALSGIGGGWALATDPSGRSVGLDPGWLDGSPFPDYRIPGLVLLVALGALPLALVPGLLRRAPWAWKGSVLLGAALVVWILVEILVVGYFLWPPLQAIYGVVGVLIVLIALLPSVQRHLRLLP